jgi:hypothetical protein
MSELLRPIKPEEFNDNAYGRCEYLMALQIHYPDFWRSLKTEVADRCEHFDRNHSDEIDALFRQWGESHHIIDLWLQDACWQTVCTWTHYPPEFLLGPDHEGWFIYVPNEPVLPYFSPVVTDSRPLFKAPISDAKSGNLHMRRFHDLWTRAEDRETPEEFESRMLNQFLAQLQEYVRFYRRRLSKRVKMQDHAAWAALMMSGKKPSEIAAQWPGMQARTRDGAFRYANPERAVYMGAIRFAKEIGLTLQK